MLNMSPHDRWDPGSNADTVGTVISPTRKNTKKAFSCCHPEKEIFITRGLRMANHAPLGIVDDSLGSGYPHTTWAWRTAAKYVLIVVKAIPSCASDVTKKHNIILDTGKGDEVQNVWQNGM